MSLDVARCQTSKNDDVHDEEKEKERDICFKARGGEGGGGESGGGGGGGYCRIKIDSPHLFLWYGRKLMPIDCSIRTLMNFKQNHSIIIMLITINNYQLGTMF